MAETDGRPVLVSQINRPGGLAGSAADICDLVCVTVGPIMCELRIDTQPAHALAQQLGCRLQASRQPAHGMPAPRSTTAVVYSRLVLVGSNKRSTFHIAQHAVPYSRTGILLAPAASTLRQQRLLLALSASELQVFMALGCLLLPAASTATFLLHAGLVGASREFAIRKQ
jgi:hypothetical protein